MKGSQRAKPKIRFWRYLLAAVVIFITGATVSYYYFKPRLALEIPFIEKIEPQESEIKHPEGKDTAGGENLLILEEREPIEDSLFTAIEKAIKKQMNSYNVILLDMSRDKKGIIYVNLSSDLKKNFKGDAFEEYSIIADLYKALKENIPDLTAMKILIENKAVDSFGGHIDISEPIGEKVIITGEPPLHTGAEPLRSFSACNT